MKYILILLLPLSANAADLSSLQIKKEIAWQAINLVDYGQTQSISKECNLSDRFEYNPVLGPCPSHAAVNKYFLASALLHYGITRYLDDNRDIWQNATIIVSGSIVYHNFSIGVKVDF